MIDLWMTVFVLIVFPIMLVFIVYTAVRGTFKHCNINVREDKVSNLILLLSYLLAMLIWFIAFHGMLKPVMDAYFAMQKCVDLVIRKVC